MAILFIFAAATIACSKCDGTDGEYTEEYLFHSCSNFAVINVNGVNDRPSFSSNPYCI